ncbi:cytochrome-c peroxidase [Bowmanella pacifica]|uniref:Methylamine utilization protein MauG n=2 Tax=Bowmanella pacifica TaxID=502051 RepID=A0A918DIN5_9ALTE|nr:cytochrome-c peroxidase [Bowmanella pacifica]
MLFSLTLQAQDSVVLSEQCPPSFELRSGQCYLVNRYQFYDSLQDRGVGGTQTGLPAFRDGFSPQQIDLGRYLFFDPLLSKDGSLSCASCHQPALGFADGRARSIGMDGQVVKRAAPSLWNVGFLKKLFWDARASTLEEQALGPLFAADEMANTPQKLLADLTGNAAYPDLFAQAYPGSDAPLTLPNVVHALAAFQTSLISLNSRYDRYALGHHGALNEQEIAGMNVYRSFVARCAECHTPPLFTNQQIAVIGTPEPEGMPLDIGAEATFKAAKLKGGFKVPTLRNIVKTAPYMHSGRFDSLRDAVEFYTKGRGHAVPAGVDMQIHWHIWEPKLTEQEIDDIVTFLGALTDESLMPVIPAKVPSGLSPLTGFQPTLNQQQAEYTDE